MKTLRDRLVLFLLCATCVTPMLNAAPPPSADSDLAQIPPAVLAPATDEHGTSDYSSRVNVDAAISAIDNRADPIFGFEGTQATAARTDLNMVYMWKLPAGLSATVSDRLSGQYVEHAPSTAVNALREAYVSWHSLAGTLYLNVGRVNIRNGVALAWNPTDYFAAGSSIPQTSADPVAVRNNRLGTAMVRAQYLWGGGSVSAAIVPKLSVPARIDAPAHSTLDPSFSSTNDRDRYLLTLSFELAGLSPQVLAYGGTGQTRLGLNLSRPIGDSVVTYAEWSGGVQQGIAKRSLAFARETGSLPDSLLPLPGQAAGSHYASDAVIGASWVIARKLTLNIEYDYHGSGLSRKELRRAENAAWSDPAKFGRQWWYLREFADYREEPLVRKQWFVRAAADNVFVRNLNFSAFTIIDAYDGSLFTQFEADYHLSDKTSLSFFVSRALGGKRSEYGSIPTAGTISFEYTRYL